MHEKKFWGNWHSTSYCLGLFNFYWHIFLFDLNFTVPFCHWLALRLFSPAFDSNLRITFRFFTWICCFFFHYLDYQFLCLHLLQLLFFFPLFGFFSVLVALYFFLSFKCMSIFTNSLYSCHK